MQGVFAHRVRLPNAHCAKARLRATDSFLCITLAGFCSAWACLADLTVCAVLALLSSGELHKSAQPVCNLVTALSMLCAPCQLRSNLHYVGTGPDDLPHRTLAGSAGRAA